MTTPNTREIAEQWFKILKSAPYADSWNIEDSFVDKLAAAWPWVQVYFELLSKKRYGLREEFDWTVVLGVYALKETLDLRFDCAAAFLMLLLISRVTAFGQAPSEKVENQCAEVINQLVKGENEKAKTDEWLKWFEELWYSAKET